MGQYTLIAVIAGVVLFVFFVVYLASRYRR